MVVPMKYISIVFLTLASNLARGYQHPPHSPSTSSAHRMTCPALHNIANGSVQITGSAAGATASYSCQTNYAMTGTSSRTCKHGAWSGSEPRCRVVYSRDSDNSFKAGHKGYKIGMK
ncbi:hypothetical protein H257_00771 [Aphanomyces astaci]|uniref:Sushi domain-containing protein n=1 Tax=Aphanomyces astaci TaxID=112090 RepID=W4HDX3_APHAT|nr:hypothetical protein H257_00771 [Aphanomyces astaci]ETV89519.1 hypothetical protein H257_00771 [Aphanomyces astaci]|eukprot:XP_009821919.1 hypothetical protein H257_00771 [Aphanomyces astaci]